MLGPTSQNPCVPLSGMLAIIWLETALAGVCVCVRLSSRVINRDHLTWDDALVGLALLCMLTMNALLTPVMPSIFALQAVMSGEMAVPPTGFLESINQYLRHQFAAIIMFWTTLWSVKASFIIFYKQLFAEGYVGWQTWGWWLVVGFCAITYVANIILQFFACEPFWTYFEAGYCMSSQDITIGNASLYLQTATDIACDLLIMMLPLSILRGLHMKTKAKLALAGLFATGVIVVLFALLRLFFTLPKKHSQVNPEWLALWSSTEAGVAVAVACAPAFRKYFAVTRGSVARSRRLSTGRSSSTARAHVEKGGFTRHSFLSDDS